MNRSIVLLLTAAALLLGSPGVALAEPASRVSAPAKANDARYKRTTRMKFRDDVVKGRRATGGGSVVNVRGGAKHSSLIVVRKSFLPELIKSADLF